MKKISKLFLSGALCAVTLMSSVGTYKPVEASAIAETGLQSTTMSGYTLYVYMNERSIQLGKMRISRESSKVRNEFEVIYQCAPYVAVGTDAYYFNYNGSTSVYKNRGAVVSATKISSNPSYAYGYARVGYNN